MLGEVVPGKGRGTIWVGGNSLSDDFICVPFVKNQLVYVTFRLKFKTEWSASVKSTPTEERIISWPLPLATVSHTKATFCHFQMVRVGKEPPPNP